MTFAIAFPHIDPIMLQIGPFAIRWYALAYISGLLGGTYYMQALSRQQPVSIKEIDISDFLLWGTLGVIIGGRLGFVVFYRPLYFLDHPLAIFQVWQGGMSFHGGLLGVIVAAILFANKRKIAFWSFADLICCAAPIGLFLGRIANFINGELFGPGMTSGVFLIGYALARSVSEFFREPDTLSGIMIWGTTWGQWLSLPMAIFGIYLIHRARNNTPTNTHTRAP
jgi:phosphatidylglycerol:prolipoprotein diacylglycerol transferase